MFPVLREGHDCGPGALGAASIETGEVALSECAVLRHVAWSASALGAFSCISVGNSDTQGIAAVFTNQQQHCGWFDVKDTSALAFATQYEGGYTPNFCCDFASSRMSQIGKRLGHKSLYLIVTVASPNGIAVVDNRQ